MGNYIYKIQNKLNNTNKNVVYLGVDDVDNESLLDMNSIYCSNADTESIITVNDKKKLKPQSIGSFASSLKNVDQFKNVVNNLINQKIDQTARSNVRISITLDETYIVDGYDGTYKLSITNNSQSNPIMGSYLLMSNGTLSNNYINVSDGSPKYVGVNKNVDYIIALFIPDKQNVYNIGFGVTENLGIKLNVTLGNPTSYIVGDLVVLIPLYIWENGYDKTSSYINDVNKMSIAGNIGAQIIVGKEDKLYLAMSRLLDGIAVNRSNSLWDPYRDNASIKELYVLDDLTGIDYDWDQKHLINVLYSYDTQSFDLSIGTKIQETIQSNINTATNSYLINLVSYTTINNITHSRVNMFKSKYLPNDFDRQLVISSSNGNIEFDNANTRPIIKLVNTSPNNSITVNLNQIEYVYRLDEMDTIGDYVLSPTNLTYNLPNNRITLLPTPNEQDPSAEDYISYCYIGTYEASQTNGNFVTPWATCNNGIYTLDVNMFLQDETIHNGIHTIKNGVGMTELLNKICYSNDNVDGGYYTLVLQTSTNSIHTGVNGYTVVMSNDIWKNIDGIFPTAPNTQGGEQAVIWDQSFENNQFTYKYAEYTIVNTEVSKLWFKRKTT